jgi:hypothetical protein
LLKTQRTPLRVLAYISKTEKQFFIFDFFFGRGRLAKALPLEPHLQPILEIGSLVLFAQDGLEP